MAVLSGICYSVLVRNTCQHSQQTRHWLNAGPMLAPHLRRWPRIKPALVQRLVFAGLSSIPVNTKHFYNICTMLDQRRRRWKNVIQMFCVCRGIAAGLVLLTACGDYKPTPTQCLLNVGPVSPLVASIHSILVSTSCWRYQHDGGTDTMTIKGKEY